MENSENPYASPQHSEPPLSPIGQAAHRGMLVLVLGITGAVVTLFGCVICGPLCVVSLGLSIPAWVIGRNDLRSIDSGFMDPAGRGATMAGMILGIIGTIVAVLIFLLTAAAIILAFVLPMLQ